MRDLTALVFGCTGGVFTYIVGFNFGWPILLVAAFVAGLMTAIAVSFLDSKNVT